MTFYDYHASRAARQLHSVGPTKAPAAKWSVPPRWLELVRDSLVCGPRGAQVCQLMQMGRTREQALTELTMASLRRMGIKS